MTRESFRHLIVTFLQMDAPSVGRDDCGVPDWPKAGAAGLTGILAGMLFVPTLQQFVYAWQGHDATTIKAFLLFLVGLLPVQILGAGGAAAYLLWKRPSRLETAIRMWNVGLSVEWSRLKGFIGRFFLMIVVSSIINILIINILQLFGVPLPESPVRALLDSGLDVRLKWLIVAVTLLWAPLAEEFLFRLVFFRMFRRLHTPLAAVLTALLFAMMHGQPHALPSLFLLGLFFQDACRRGGIREAFFMHSLNNLCALLLLM